MIEPLVSTQWFVHMKPLAQKAMEAVRSGRIRFVPDDREVLFFQWMENIRDWCISRQLWWGHRIPAWYCRNGRHDGRVGSAGYLPKMRLNRTRAGSRCSRYLVQFRLVAFFDARLARSNRRSAKRSIQPRS